MTVARSGRVRECQRRIAAQNLASITSPLLVIVGTKDQMLEGSRANRRDVPGSKLVELEGASHLSSVDAADGYNRALDAHIGSAS